MEAQEARNARRRRKTESLRNMRAQSVAANATLAGPSRHRILSPTAVVPKPGPLPRRFPDLPEFVPIPPFPSTSSVTPRTSPDPVEQDMLDNGIITGEDLDIQSGIIPPYLGPNVHDPLAFHELVVHHEKLNAAVSRAATPLTSRAAHSLPKPTPAERELNRALRKAYEEPAPSPADEDSDARMSSSPPPHSDSSEASVNRDWQFHMDPGNMESEGEDSDEHSFCSEESDVVAVKLTVSVNAEDNPDPFHPQTLNVAPTDISALPPHLLAIYCVVAWLHSQFHLPRLACDALLTIWALLIAYMAPSFAPPVVTLKSANSAIAGEKNGPDGELRLGLTWGVDWFSYIRSANAPSHSSCPTSFAISNLPSEYRYRTANLICTSILPGPKEQTADEVQRFIRPIVSDLLRLYQDGIVVPTPSHPEGRRVRVVLLAVVCDKPAAHKIGGFASHSHTCYCTMCWTTIKDKKTAESFKANAFKPRTNEEQRELGAKYQKLKNNSQRDKFVKEHATRYTQLSRLPYFDLVQQIVIDPMHNLLMGLTKTHFHTIWVQGKILREKHELRVFHEMLANFTLPSTCGKLPKELGLTSGGSLTADQWLLLGTVYGPIIIPQLWSACIPEKFDILSNNRVAHIARQEAAQEKKKADAAAVKAAKAADKKKEKEALQKAERERKKAERDRKKREKNEEAERKRADRETKKAQRDAQQQETGTNQPRRGHKKKNIPSTDTATVIDNSAASTSTPQAENILAGTSMDIDTVDTANSISPAPIPEVQPSTTVPSAETSESETPFNLHPDDPGNFLKLSAALSILQQETLWDADIDNADSLIREYCTELITLYGASSLKPNHHYATHTSECVRNFGPLREFWTFLFERLNKVLKSIKTNNHGNGELETTFFREFHQTCQLSRVRFCMSRHDSDSLLSQVSAVMNKASNEDRGTVAQLAALSHDLDRFHRDAKISSQLSPRSKIATMSDETYRQLADALTIHYPDIPVHCISDSPRSPASLPLETRATFYSYVIVNGKRYYASSGAKSNKSSLIQVAVSRPTGVSIRCGELLEIFKFQQFEGATELWFGRMRWFTPYRGPQEPIWQDFAPHNVSLWEIEEYIPWSQLHPIIDLENIQAHLARSVVSLGPARSKAWATIVNKGVGDASADEDE
ncbi:hypothetical protein MVEN_00081200 [Mycena venus]|uniref:Transposase domain-containing protein n=1 Tax=Mycena venus TaxID=2733690 RepID=A0A8H6Z4K5_9AGAR|nr:hypothetical protein MVEN_00081200 [Mycena venus]